MKLGLQTHNAMSQHADQFLFYLFLFLGANIWNTNLPAGTYYFEMGLRSQIDINLGVLDTKKDKTNNSGLKQH